MQISLIAAMAKNHVIGKDNQMPWHLPADLKHFKSITLNKPVVMGRKTFTSIGRPLPNRRNIIISRQANLRIAGVEVLHSLSEIYQVLQNEPEVMIIGGQVIFEQVLNIATRMYLTFIDLDVEGDAFFPAWQDSEWQLVAEEQHSADRENPYPYRFVEFTRKLAR